MQQQYLGLGGHAGFAGQLCGGGSGKADSNYLGLFNTAMQLMHYTLALALALLAVEPRTPQNQQLRLPERSGGARLAQGSFGDLGCGQQALHHITDHDDTTDRRFNRMRPSIAPRKRHQSRLRHSIFPPRCQVHHQGLAFRRVICGARRTGRRASSRQVKIAALFIHQLMR